MAGGFAAVLPATASTAASQTSANPVDSCVAAPNISDEPIGYLPCGTSARNLGVSHYDAAVAKKAYTVTINTNHGDIDFTADGTAAPYTVYSFVYLVKEQYYTDTPCHRLTTDQIQVLQRGDPSGTGTGGPGYEFQDENLASLGTPDSAGLVTYKTGTVATVQLAPASRRALRPAGRRAHRPRTPRTSASTTGSGSSCAHCPAT